MSSDNHMNNSEKEVDEVDAALSDLEITLEGGKTSNTLVWQHWPSMMLTTGSALNSVVFFKIIFSPSLQGFVFSVIAARQ